MDQYVINVANEILSQLKATMGLSVIWSWGVQKMTCTLVNGEMPALMLHVSGRLFKGYVLVALDEGSDTYKIFTKKTMHGELTCICEECYCDNFGEIIDRYVESGEDETEYKQWIEEQYSL